jgi:CAAX prenyl protease-like protein
MDSRIAPEDDAFGTPARPLHDISHEENEIAGHALDRGPRHSGRIRGASPPALMPTAPSPALARILPFAAYVAFMVLESVLPEQAVAGGPLGGKWLYALQLLATAALLAWLWPRYGELRAAGARAADWALAVAVGLVVFVLWINLDLPWARIGESRGLAETAGTAPPLALLLLRAVGAALIVPVMEELFWRSFILRWVENPKFLEVDPRRTGWKAILVSSALFGAEHHLWLAGILAGVAYALLYRRTGSLWTVIVAHAVTNAALEFWVWRTGSFQFV